MVNARAHRSTAPKLALVMACICAMASVAGHSAAQDGPLSGTWRYLGGDAERDQRYAAVDRATAEMGVLTRGPARRQLRERTAPTPELTLRDEGDRVTITGGGHRIALRTDGSPTRAAGQTGEGTLQATRRNGQLVVTARGDSGGTRKTTYHLSDDGRQLILEVQMSGGRLSAPLHYRVTYRRVPAQAG